MIVAVGTAPFVLVLEDLGLRPERVRALTEEPGPRLAGGGHAIAGISAGQGQIESSAQEVRDLAEKRISADGALLLFLQGSPEDGEIVRWRNALWPFAHVGALYRLSHLGIERETLQGRTALRGASGLHGILLAAYRREHVLSPAATVAKFDQNAASWAGDPGSAGYAHHRWMRRFVAAFARPKSPPRPSRILDFGCGAGWVGIEAALLAPGASLCAFDPSPEMVQIAAENARAAGVKLFEARTGFGEDPPFPAAGEEPFELVISSGVVSFAPDTERWLDGLARTVAPGGTLVIGDIHRDSKGTKRRRATKLLLPAREMNARTREEVRSGLERRGFAFEAWAGYQLTWPIPEAMHFSERRLRGLLNPALLAWNRRSAERDARSGSPDPDRFDSWVMRLRRA